MDGSGCKSLKEFLVGEMKNMIKLLLRKNKNSDLKFFKELMNGNESSVLPSKKLFQEFQNNGGAFLNAELLKTAGYNII